MSLDLSPEQKAIGKANFDQASGDLARQGRMRTLAVGGPDDPDRRDILKAGLAAGAVVPVSAAVYFGYQSWRGNKAVRTALIGTGDEGGVLVGDHNPEFNEIIAICDIRPTNRKRIIDGEERGPRKGLRRHYGDAVAREIAEKRTYHTVEALLADKDKLGLEAVIIATPLNTHDIIAKKCMDAGLHVLCEKLMAHDVSRCKDMIRYAKEKGVLLSIGHQRHYSTLYAQAIELIENGILGDIRYIRALWHRNNSWPYDPKAFNEKKFDKTYGIPAYVDSWWKEVPIEDAKELTPEKLKELAFADPEKYGFRDVAELVRWRCFNRTGGGLMAELGSHQLDASSIILGHVRPLTVSGVGGKFFYGRGDDPSRGNDREGADTVFVTYEFPGRTYYERDDRGRVVLKNGKPIINPKGKDDIVIVTFSSINTNEFENYGEWVMGTQGTMFLEKEADVYLWRERDKSKKGDTGGRDTKITVTTAGGGKPVMESTSTWGGGGSSASTGKAAGGSDWNSAVRGYRTEMEHFAFCIREWQKRGEKVSYETDGNGHLKYADILPRCHGEVAMADAILALTANIAMETGQRIKFRDEWFDPNTPDAPEIDFKKRA